ncbi:MAG: anthranilate phosphoribosyltransferase [Halanaerobiaceae bacterium]
MFTEKFKKVVAGKDLTTKEMEKVMDAIMEGQVPPCRLAGFLVGLRSKGETISEITGAARVMRDKAENVSVSGDLIDTCGTGGDGSNSFNISTTTALVLAGGGFKVAKHGNRSVSSKSGSADVLESMGINLELAPGEVEKCMQKTGMGFLFAPVFHKAMKHAVRPRKELGLRTIFNVLGPLTNPAQAEYQVLGVFDPELVEPLAHVLKNLGLKGAMVVHGAGGLDEFSLKGKNKVAHLQDGEVKVYNVTPEDAGLDRAGLEAIKGGDPETNRQIIMDILKGIEQGPKRDIVLLNTAAALIVTGEEKDWSQAVSRAAKILDSGQPLKKVKQLKKETNSQDVA